MVPSGQRDIWQRNRGSEQGDLGQLVVLHHLGVSRVILRRSLSLLLSFSHLSSDSSSTEVGPVMTQFHPGVLSLLEHRSPVRLLQDRVQLVGGM